MLYPESVPSTQLSARAAERYAQLTAVAQLRTERKRERQGKTAPKPAIAVS